MNDPRDPDIVRRRLAGLKVLSGVVDELEEVLNRIGTALSSIPEIDNDTALGSALIGWHAALAGVSVLRNIVPRPTKPNPN